MAAWQCKNPSLKFSDLIYPHLILMVPCLVDAIYKALLGPTSMVFDNECQNYAEFNFDDHGFFIFLFYSGGEMWLLLGLGLQYKWIYLLRK